MYFIYKILLIMCNGNVSTQKMRYSGHAKERSCERSIKLDKEISYDEISKMPIYTTDNGCTKYLDIRNNIVYYVRKRSVVTMIKTNPIQMLRYYAFGKGLNFNKLCRDNVFNNCQRKMCKYVHVNFEGV